MPIIFVALALGTEARQNLDAVLALARREAPAARWSTQEQLHLTVAYLGAVPTGRLNELGAIADGVAAVHAPFRLALDTPGTFGPHVAPRVVWLGLTGDLHSLAVLRTALAHTLRGAGFSLDEKPFHPHITLARPRPPHSTDALTGLHSAMAIHPLTASPWQVTALQVMKSERTSAGSVYSVVRESPLTSMAREK